MKNNTILMPLFRTIDKLLFGIEEINEIDRQADLIDSDNEEEFEVEQSSN
jgi:hypothetical protein